MANTKDLLFEEEVKKLAAFIHENFPNEEPGPGQTVVDLAIRMLTPDEEKTGWFKSVKADFVGKISRCLTCQARVILSPEGWVHMAPYGHIAIPDQDWKSPLIKKDV